MAEIIEKSITAGELPPQLRGGFDPGASVLVSVRELTDNGFTMEFENHVLAAEKSGVSYPVDIKDAIDLLRKMADENKLR